MTASSLGACAAVMIDALARCSDDAGRLNRPYLSQAHKQAADLVGQWNPEAGL